MSSSSSSTTATSSSFSASSSSSCFWWIRTRIHYILPRGLRWLMPLHYFGFNIPILYICSVKYANVNAVRCPLPSMSHVPPQCPAPDRACEKCKCVFFFFFFLSIFAILHPATGYTTSKHRRTEHERIRCTLFVIRTKRATPKILFESFACKMTDAYQVRTFYNVVPVVRIAAVCVLRAHVYSTIHGTPIWRVGLAVRTTVFIMSYSNINIHNNMSIWNGMEYSWVCLLWRVLQLWLRFV